MKRSLIRGFGIISFVVLLLGTAKVYAQDDARQQSIRLTWDNDFLNYRGKGTDRYYTNGLQLEYNYMHLIGPHSFAKEVQTWAHRAIAYTKPEGWGKPD
jgi:hypothetical protein